MSFKALPNRFNSFDWRSLINFGELTQSIGAVFIISEPGSSRLVLMNSIAACWLLSGKLFKAVRTSLIGLLLGLSTIIFESIELFASLI